MYLAMFTRARADKFALPNRLARILFLVHTRLLRSSQNAVYVTLSKELAKLLYLSDRSMRRMTNAVSWDSVQNLCLAIKSMFGTTSCMCNLSSLKIHLFFLNERWYKLWLKIAITCFSNTRFTCKIISAFYIWHIKAGKVVLLRPKLETILAPVSYRSSRRRRHRKRLLLKVPIKWLLTRLENHFKSNQTCFYSNLGKVFQLPEFQAKLFFKRNLVGCS